MAIDGWTLFLQILNFLVLVWLLHHFLYRPVTAMVTRRQQEIENAFSEAAAQARKASELRQRCEAQLAGLEAERQSVLRQAQGEAAAARERILAQARAEGEAQAKALRAQIEEERHAAAAMLADRAADLAAEMAARLLEQVRGPAVDGLFLARLCAYLRDLPETRRSELRGEASAAAAVEVVTASALPAEEQETWRQRLAHCLGAMPAFAFRVDPGLIAGAELRLPQSRLAFHWRAALAEARNLVQADAHA